MKFAIVELAHAIITDVGSDWEEMKVRVEGETVNRWNNPVLIALPDNFPIVEPGEQEEGEVYGLLGGGTHYKKVVDELRRLYREQPTDFTSTSKGSRLKSKLKGMQDRGRRKFVSLVVAIPESGWGHGTRFSPVVNRNRRRLGLPSTFGLPTKELGVIEFRKKLTELGPVKGIHLLSLSDTYLSESEGREESLERLKKLLELKEREDRKQ